MEHSSLASIHPARSIQLLRPFQLVAVAAPGTWLHPLVLQSLAARVERGERVGAVIGHNRFDLYALTRLARQHGFDPTHWLTQIQLSRAFTCHQLHHRLVTLDRTMTRGWSALYVLGLLDTFADESVEAPEAAQLLTATLAALKRIARAGLPVLITASVPSVSGREPLIRSIARGVDEYWELTPSSATPRLSAPPRLTGPVQLTLPLGY